MPVPAPDSEPLGEEDEIPEPEEVRDAWHTLAREVRIFRARLEDELTIAIDALLPDVAADILGRELRLQAVDIARIVAAAIDRYTHDEPLRIRVHPRDKESLAGMNIAIVCDESLRSGDAILELRSGNVDATLGARLETLLQESARR